jgi:hypothetical protein
MKNGEVELRQHFFVRNEYALRLQKVFYPIWITFHIWDIITRPIPQLNLGFDTLTVNPVPETTVDGSVKQTGTHLTWSQLRDGAGNGYDYAAVGGGQFAIIRTDDSSNTWDWLGRYICLFTTSSLTAGADISAATLSLFGVSKSDSLSVSPTINIYTSSPSNNDVLVNSDYSQIGTTAQCNTDMTYSNYSITGYNDFSLNSSGISNISKTGISKFGVRSNYDASNTMPTWTNYSVFNFGGYFSSETSNKPKLVVTYTAAPTFIPQIINS